MDDPTSFQEKTDWGGKIKEKLTSFLSKKKENHGLDGEINDLSPTLTHTLSQKVSQNWKTGTERLTQLFSAKSQGDGSLSLLSPSVINRATLLIALVLLSYVGSDLTSITLERYIPNAPSFLSKGMAGARPGLKVMTDYEIIISRNLFNSRGLIPGDDEIPAVTDSNNAPVKTSLPLSLIGTVVLKNEFRSIATIEDKGSQEVFPVRVDDEITGKIKIISIDAYKVVFLNLSNGRREYVDLPDSFEAPPMNLGGTSSRSSAPSAAGSTIEQTSNNQFNLPRAEIDRTLADLNKVLTEARAIPHTENGAMVGYKLIQIVPGSIYEKLGLKNGDILTGLNGEPVNNPAKAWELLGQLKTQSRMELSVKRDGKISNFTYDIR